MRGTTRSRLPSPAGAAAAALALLACLGAGRPAAAVGAEPGGPGSTCILLFTAGAGQGSGITDLADLRALGEQELAAALARSGDAALPADAALALQRRFRVRDGRLLPPAFLAGLDSAGADRLLVAHLYVGRGRIELAGRTLSTGGGLIEAAATETCSLAGAAWRIDFAIACRRFVATLAAAVRPRAGAPVAPLAVFPLGFDATAAQIATQALLEAALADTARAVLDPAVLGGALAAAGLDPRRPDRSGLDLLAGSFAAGEATLVEMITRDPDQIVRASDDDAPASSAVSWETVRSFSLHLRTVDTRTGLVTAAHGVDQDNSPARGWFGNTASNAPRQLIAAAMNRLWEASRQPGKVR
ncbi:MAG: hypothetical protein IPM94_14070 [bacterium]|nr:hypothetical protein [bacterium]